MIAYPMKFEVSTTSVSGIKTALEASAESFDPITCAIPSQFNGPGGGYSPEDLLALSLTTCLIATFKVFAEKSPFAYERIQAKAYLTIDRVGGTVAISKIDVEMTLYGVQDQQKATALMQQAEKYCLVSNTLKVEKSLSLHFQ
ncbi:MAG TPA: OsmC family protein [Rhabdochlamydiaceae bacterium]|nr:OsmC family protein [Rhabdochlamydiaceae bacterium]